MKKLLALILSLIFALSLVTAVNASEYVSRDGWKVTASTTDEGWVAELMLDGSESSYWHSGYDHENSSNKDEAPFYLTFYLPSVTTLSGLAYTTRSSNNTGAVLSYNVYASTSNQGEAQLIYSGSFDKELGTKEAKFGFNVDVKTVVFEITEGNWGYGCCAEFNLISATGSDKKTIDQASNGRRVIIGKEASSASTVKTISHEGWTATASSTDGSLEAALTIDENENSYWHSAYNHEDGSKKDEAPFTLTYKLPKKTAVSGFVYTPRKSNVTGSVTEYKLYASDADTGKAYLLSMGEFTQDVNKKTVSFGYDVDVKTVIFEIESGAYGYGCCAEFDLIEAEGGTVKKLTEASLGSTMEIGGMPGSGTSIDGTVTGKKSWTIKASSEKEPWYKIEKAIDGKTDTFWHTDYTDDGTNILTHEKNPHWIEIDLPEVTEISGFKYTPRNSTVGIIMDYEFYISDSDTGEWFKAKEGRFSGDVYAKEIKFVANIKAKRVKLQSITSNNDYAAIAEFDLLVKDEALTTVKNHDEYLSLQKKYELVEISHDEMNATASSVWRYSNNAAMSVDGIQKTAWHSHTDDHNKFPITLTVDLGSRHKVCEFIYYPRIDDKSGNGIWLDFNIWAGDSTGDMELIAENVSFIDALSAQKYTFDEPVEARYIEFEILNGKTGYATCGDLSFFERKSDAEEMKEKATKYMLTIGSDILKVEEDGEITEIKLDVAPYIDWGYTQIPVRGLLEQMGAEFTWDGENSKVYIKSGKTEIEMQIDNELVYVTSPTFGRVRYTLHSAPQIKNSRTFVPVRFISENLGYTVEWDDTTKTVTIIEG